MTVVEEELPGATAIPKSSPVPLSGTVCGLFGALSVAVSVAVREPLAVGVNVTFTAQFVPPARLAPQVLPASAKSPLFAPVIEILLMFSAALPTSSRDTATV